MKSEQRQKTATSSAKGKTATGLSCAKPGLSTKQKRKIPGNYYGSSADKDVNLYPLVSLIILIRLSLSV